MIEHDILPKTGFPIMLLASRPGLWVKRVNQRKMRRYSGFCRAAERPKLWPRDRRWWVSCQCDLDTALRFHALVSRRPDSAIAKTGLFGECPRRLPDPRTSGPRACKNPASKDSVL